MENRRNFAIALFFSIIVFIFLGVSKPKSDPIIGYCPVDNSGVEMPLVLDTNPETASIVYSAPDEQRGQEYAKWLQAGLRIHVTGGFGSGTIVYYDKQNNWAYVASCGHLWSGTKTADQVKRNPVTAEVTTWYHNLNKLASPKTYKAEVLFWSNVRGRDSSLLRFHPDWEPKYFPIASLNYNYQKGSHQHSIGCDGAREIAHYDIVVEGIRGSDLVTSRNSPRPGRSGGGLISDESYYIATCWGTSNTDGSGIGYFTPLSAIHSVYSNNGYGWLLNLSYSEAWNYPIINKSGSEILQKEYIILPGANKVPVN